MLRPTWNGPFACVTRDCQCQLIHILRYTCVYTYFVRMNTGSYGCNYICALNGGHINAVILFKIHIKFYIHNFYISYH